MNEVTVGGISSWIDTTQKYIDEVEDDNMEKELLKKKVYHLTINKGYWRNHLDKGKFEYSFYCTECGCPEGSNWISGVKERLLEERKCHSCSHWYHIAKEYQETATIESVRCCYRGSENKVMIIKGVLYSDAGYKENTCSSILGYAGAVFNIKDLSTGEVITTNNLWRGGEVPKKYRLSLMKDTHEFMGSEV